MSPAQNQHLRFALLQAMFTVALSFRGSDAFPGIHHDLGDILESWKQRCNCTCWNHRFRLRRNCTKENTFKVNAKGKVELTTGQDDHSNLTRIQIPCSRVNKARRKFDIIFIKYSCTRKAKGRRNIGQSVNVYTVYKERHSSELMLNTIASNPSVTSANNSSTNDKNTKGKLSLTLVIGLSVGVGVAAVFVALCCLCCNCRKKKNMPKKEENEQHDYIEVDEDSHPYRIVDITTNVSRDHAGYTFLDAPKQEEEKPYMKLNASCSNGTKECTKICSDKFIKVRDSDEPVYFLLEGKPNANNGS